MSDTAIEWLIDGNNVFGSRPDGWWNDRQAAGRRLTQQIAEWCRTHDQRVTVVFDRPVDDQTTALAGGNLRIELARRSGRDAADDRIIELLEAILSSSRGGAIVVTSDRRLRDRCLGLAGDDVELVGAGRFLAILEAV